MDRPETRNTAYGDNEKNTRNEAEERGLIWAVDNIGPASEIPSWCTKGVPGGFLQILLVDSQNIVLQSNNLSRMI